MVGLRRRAYIFWHNRSRGARYALATAGALFALLIVALATSPLWLTPLLQTEKPALEAALTRDLGAPVRVRAVAARVDWRPGIMLRGGHGHGPGGAGRGAARRARRSVVAGLDARTLVAGVHRHRRRAPQSSQDRARRARRGACPSLATALPLAPVPGGDACHESACRTGRDCHAGAAHSLAPSARCELDHGYQGSYFDRCGDDSGGCAAAVW